MKAPVGVKKIPYGLPMYHPEGRQMSYTGLAGTVWALPCRASVRPDLGLFPDEKIGFWFAPPSPVNPHKLHNIKRGDALEKSA